MAGTRTAPRRRRKGTPYCDVWRSGTGDNNCPGIAAVPYRAACGCGHPIEGTGCLACLASVALGCLACWKQDESERHMCPVTFSGRGHLREAEAVAL